jgi:hypothetical protein
MKEGMTIIAEKMREFGKPVVVKTPLLTEWGSQYR